MTTRKPDVIDCIVRMPMPLYEAMKARAVEEERSFAAQVRHVCGWYLKREVDQ